MSTHAMLLAGAGAVFAYLVSRARRGIPLDELPVIPSEAFDESSDPETAEAETGDLLILLVESLVAHKAAELSVPDVLDFEITGMLDEGYYGEVTEFLIVEVITATVGDTVEQSTKDKYISRYIDPEYALELANLLYPSVCDLYPEEAARIQSTWASRGGNETYGFLACQTEN